MRLSTWYAGVVVGGIALSAVFVQPAFAVTSRTISLAAPTSTTTASTMTMRGELSHSPTGSLVAIRRRSSTGWLTVGYTRTTDPKGSFARGIRAPSIHGTYYYDAYAAATSHLSAAISTAHAVIVRTRVSVSLATSASSPLDGSAITLSGTITPFVAGTRAYLQRAVGSGTWSTLRTLALTTTGHYSQSVIPPSDVSSAYRVGTGTFGYYAAGTSAPIKVFPKAAPFNWDAPTQPVVPASAAGFFECPTKTFCMLAGGGSYQVWNSGVWSSPQPLPYQMVDASRSLSCSGPAFCMLVDAQSYAVFDGHSWTGKISAIQTLPGNVFESVSCTSATFCMATTFDGESAEWNGTAWSIGPRFGASGWGYTDPVTCPATNLCWAGIGPAWNGTTWTPIENGDPANTNWLDHMSCTSTSFCMYVDSLGGMSEYTAANGWTSISSPWSSGDTALPDVACQSASSCVSVAQTDNGQATLVSTFSGSTWTTPVILHSGIASNPLVACPTTQLCMEVDVSDRAGDEEVASYSSGVWSTPSQVTQANSLVDVSCVHGGLCHALEYAGNTRTYDGTTWSSPIPVDPSGGAFSARAISCATDTFCGVVDSDGGVVIESGGTRGPRQVVIPPGAGVAPGAGVYWISCTSDGSCMVTSNTGSVAQYLNGQWTTTTPSSQYIVGPIACGSANYCVTTNGQWWNGTAWAASASGGSASTCTSTSDCILALAANWTGQRPTAIHLVAGVAHGSPTPIGPPNSGMGQQSEAASSIACATASRCVSLVNGQLNTFSPGGVTLGPTILWATPGSVSCAGSNLCVAIIGDVVSIGR